jgi:hypothetical protein
VRDDGHDDLADSVTQAINYVAGTGPMRVTTATYGHGHSVPQQQLEAPALRRSAIPGFR